MNYSIFWIVTATFLIEATWAQNPYEQCVQECIASGLSELECRSDYCDPSDTVGTVDIGQGNPLQLFSYELVGPAPVIDGSLMSRDGNPSNSDAVDEWQSAASRTLILSDSGIAQLFLVNTADTLYVGITYEHGNNGDGCGVVLYFDEGTGSPPAALDGESDFTLTSDGGLCNEQAGSVLKAGGSNATADKCWNGTAWVDDGDGQTDFRADRHFFNSDKKVHHYEFAIPLNNSKTDDSTNSDLDLLDSMSVGFYLEVIKTGTGAGTFHWNETNGEVAAPDSFPHWGKIQLSVKRGFFTFYTGRSSGASPTVDGAIDEAVWNGAYQRDLTLSNYHYGTLQARFWGLEDSSANEIYAGVRVYDNVYNPGDYCQIYMEEVGENATDSIRDYDLDGDAENSLRVTGAGQVTDYYWDITTGQWAVDTEPADSQTAAYQSASGYVECEFRLSRSGGTQDIDIPRGGFLGMLIRYYDADRGGGEHSNFYWEYTTNNDAQLLSQHNSPFYYLSTGWNNLQLGGPYIEVTAPASGDTVFGSMEIEAIISNDVPTAVVYYLVGDTSMQWNLSDVGGGVWSDTMDLTGVPVGPQTLVVRITASTGVLYNRLVDIVVSGAPDIQITSPVANDTVFGSVAMEVLIGNDNPAAVSAYLAGDTTTQWSLSDSGGGLWKGLLDLTGAPTGLRTLVARVNASNGGTYEQQVNVIVIDGPGIQVTSPSANDTVFGSVSMDVSVSNDAPTAVEVYLAADSTIQWSLADSGGGLWKGLLDLTSVPADSQTLVVRVHASNGGVYENQVDVVVIDGPDIQVTSPSANDTVFGSVSLEVLIGNDVPTAVEAYLSGDTSTQWSLVDSGGGLWVDTLDLTSAPRDSQTLVVRVHASNGDTYEQQVNVIVTDPVVGLGAVILPEKLFLKGHWPGDIVVGLERTGAVDLQLRNFSGQNLWSHRLQPAAPGYYQVPWPNRTLQSGIHFLTLRRGQEKIIRRIVVVK